MHIHHIQWKERGEKADVNNHARRRSRTFQNYLLPELNFCWTILVAYQHLRSDARFPVTKRNEVLTDIICVGS